MGKRERGGRWVENPEDIGVISDPNFVRLPEPLTLFRTRAERFRSLVPGNALGAYLGFLAVLSQAQHEASSALSAPPAVDAEALEIRLAAGMPPLAPDLRASGGTAFHAVLKDVLDATDTADAPAEVAAARDAVASRPPADSLALAETILMGSYPSDRLGEGLFVAAALQVFLAGCAAALPAARLRPVGDGVCPACGGPPVSSMLVGWAGADRVRYCACSLCQTMWNYVRIKCTCCASTEKIAYFTAGEIGRAASVETCGVCRSYIKHLNQHDEPSLDPVADDVATFGLDLLIRQDDFRPGGVNPLFISA